jgi:tetratricopeptide (TPR) repeat protein
VEAEQVQRSPSERDGQQAAEAIKQGFQHLENEEYRQAIESFTQAIRLCPTLTDAYMARACAHEDKEEFDLAIADCTEAIRLNPESARAYRLRGQIYTKTGKWAEAERDTSKARRAEARQQ